MSIKSYKVQILIIYVIFMFLNSIIPVFEIKNLWRWDKTIHFIEFFLLGYLFMNALIDAKIDKYKFSIGVFVLTLIPIIDEGLQFVFDIPGRVPDFNDFIADLCGEYVGVLSFVLVNKLRKK